MLFSMEFPLGREIMTTVRLTAGGLGSLAGLDIDASEDLKVCVTESLLLLLHSGCSRAKVTFEQADGMCVTLLGEGGDGFAEKTVEEEISAALLGALVEGLTMEHGEGSSRISFVFKGL